MGKKIAFNRNKVTKSPLTNDKHCKYPIGLILEVTVV